MIEMTITIAIVSILAVLGAKMLGKSFQSYDLAAKTTDTDWQGRVAMERLVRELRLINSASATDLVFSGTQISFNTLDGSGVCYRLLGTTLQRSADGPAGACGGTSPQTLADNITAGGLNFYYYDSAGNVTAAAASVFYITVTLQVVESSAAGNINETYRATVQPRNF
jgi:hypothetical protein